MTAYDPVWRGLSDLMSNAPAPTLTVEQASKTHPHAMTITRATVTGIDRLGRARPRPYARNNHRPGSRGSMSGGE